MSQQDTSILEEDWPASVPKPQLPKGYEWVCLRRAFGLQQPGGEHPWWIRLCWTMRSGKKRMLKTGEKFFATPQEAIDFAIVEAVRHRLHRQRAERARK